MASRMERKEAEIAELREENSQLMKIGKNDRELEKQVNALRRRSINHAKEQVAVKTIMEKIQILVDGIIASRSESGKSEKTGSLENQFSALSSLVNASVKALRS
mmetsp:Transcript_5471/g.6403  ORF Transcript_5471/g.6403 Transcript_5471/m.6403 type:complete len:104 (+) Transcript_5471:158-469(+)